jgi:hypothetical protein
MPSPTLEPSAVDAPAEPRVPFPPPNIPPPHTRSAQEGDGIWVPFGSGDADTGALYKTVLHPHKASRFISVTLVAIDLTRVALQHLPGKGDVGKKEVPFEPGLVPPTERDQLLAVFNGGFQPRHGGWGMRYEETTLVEPKDAGCTIALYKDGRVRIRSWLSLSSEASEMRVVRQTPPCLLEEHELHPDLARGQHRVWGGRVPGKVTRRRSALGIDKTGKILFYAVGREASPQLLAEGLRFAGAEHAAQLDVNWAWTRFLRVGKDSDGELELGPSLVEVDFGKNEYLERASDRDFFYLVGR